MNDIIKMIFKSVNETDNLYRKINLLEKKKDKMGLIEDEEFELKDLRVKYFIRSEEIISNIVEVILNKIMTELAIKSLNKIQEFIPWKGRLLIHSEEVDAVMNAVYKLDESELSKVRKELRKLHREIFKSINDVCQSDTVLDSFEKFGDMISSDGQGGIMEALSYIDTIYKDFGEIVGVELDSVVVDFDEEE